MNKVTYTPLEDDWFQVSIPYAPGEHPTDPRGGVISFKYKGDQAPPLDDEFIQIQKEYALTGRLRVGALVLQRESTQEDSRLKPGKPGLFRDSWNGHWSKASPVSEDGWSGGWSQWHDSRRYRAYKWITRLTDTFRRSLPMALQGKRQALFIGLALTGIALILLFALVTQLFAQPATILDQCPALADVERIEFRAPGERGVKVVLTDTARDTFPYWSLGVGFESWWYDVADAPPTARPVTMLRVWTEDTETPQYYVMMFGSDTDSALLYPAYFEADELTNSGDDHPNTCGWWSLNAAFFDELQVMGTRYRLRGGEWLPE